MAFMNMKPETKAKWQRRWYNFKQELIPIGVGATVGAGWVAYICTLMQDKQIKNLEARADRMEALGAEVVAKHNGLVDTVNHNAEAGNMLRDRVADLERQNALLLEKALEKTEGKTE